MAHSVAQGTQSPLLGAFLAFRCFHARKGSIAGTGVGSMILPPIIDYFCPPIIVALCESQTSTLIVPIVKIFILRCVIVCLYLLATTSICYM